MPLVHPQQCLARVWARFHNAKRVAKGRVWSVEPLDNFVEDSGCFGRCEQRDNSWKVVFWIFHLQGEVCLRTAFFLDLGSEDGCTLGVTTPVVSF